MNPTYIFHYRTLHTEVFCMFLCSQQETVHLFRLAPSTETTIITKHLHVCHVKQTYHKN
jgi:hypothetical protein